MKKQIRLADSHGKVIKTTINAISDVVIVFEDEAFCFLHPTNGYDGSDADFDEPDFWDGLWKWCISRDALIKAGMATSTELDELGQQRTAQLKVEHEARERRQYELLKAKFDPTATR